MYEKENKTDSEVGGKHLLEDKNIKADKGT